MTPLPPNPQPPSEIEQADLEADESAYMVCHINDDFSPYVNIVLAPAFLIFLLATIFPVPV